MILTKEQYNSIHDLLSGTYSDGETTSLAGIMWFLKTNGYDKDTLQVKKMSSVISELDFLEVLDPNAAQGVTLHFPKPAPQPQNVLPYLYLTYSYANEKAIILHSPTGAQYFTGRAWTETNVPEFTKGKGTWFTQPDIKNPFVQYAKADPKKIYAEAISFEQNHPAGSVVRLPIRSKGTDTIQVALGPTYWTVLKRSDIDATIPFSQYKQGMVYDFKVIGYHSEAGKQITELQAIPAISEYDTDLPSPETLRKTLNIHADTLQRILSETIRLKPLKDALGTDIQSDTLRNYICERYREQLEDHTLRFTKRKNGLRMNIDMNFKDLNGVPQMACINRNVNHPDFYLSQICSIDPSLEMERHVFIEDWDKITEELASLALNETWDFVNEQYGRRFILKQYLRYNFYKAKIDGQLYEENGNALFNTGLVDNQYDSIFCLLTANNSFNDRLRHKYQIAYFACRGKGANGKELNRLFAKFPPAPEYIRADQYENIFFDTTKDLSCDYEHILMDNLRRLPLDFITHSLSYEKPLMTMIENNAPFQEISAYITDRDDLLRALENGLKSSVEDAVKYCKWNYKTAIPIYYPRTNTISLLLPLSLVGKKTDAEIALVIERLPNGNYQGQTILTLDMAYMDARQICRPNSEWLTVETITESEHEEEE